MHLYQILDVYINGQELSLILKWSLAHKKGVLHQRQRVHLYLHPVFHSSQQVSLETPQRMRANASLLLLPSPSTCHPNVSLHIEKGEWNIHIYTERKQPWGRNKVQHFIPGLCIFLSPSGSHPGTAHGSWACLLKGGMRSKAERRLSWLCCTQLAARGEGDRQAALLWNKVKHWTVLPAFLSASSCQSHAKQENPAFLCFTHWPSFDEKHLDSYCTSVVERMAFSAHPPAPSISFPLSALQQVLLTRSWIFIQWKKSSLKAPLFACMQPIIGFVFTLVQPTSCKTWWASGWGILG